jgi:hypothetical protein
MVVKRQIEVFSAACSVCETTIDLVHRLASSSDEVIILNMHDPHVARRAQQLSIRSVPAIVIDGALADCCAGRGVDEATLRAAGLGQPL